MKHDKSRRMLLNPKNNVQLLHLNGQQKKTKKDKNQTEFLSLIIISYSRMKGGATFSVLHSGM